jgi:hypothetical protein
LETGPTAGESAQFLSSSLAGFALSYGKIMVPGTAPAEKSLLLSTDRSSNRGICSLGGLSKRFPFPPAIHKMILNQQI